MLSLKRMKLLSAFLALCMVSTILAGFVPSAIAQDPGDTLFTAIEPMVAVYNANVDKIPFIKTVASNARINAEITLNDGSVLILGIVTDSDAKVVSFVKGEIADPTIRAYSTEATVDAILSASNPIAAFQDALESGAIRYEGVGLGNSLKVGVMKAGMWVLGFFT
ncbi:MAG: hypothetical protein JW945_06365 [Methanomicrobia archaeon]|nr:hypothetical protein [Methanomicrobia archaeon]